MLRTKKFTLVIIVVIALAVFIIPYFYNKLVHSPGHSTETGVPQ